MTQDLNRTDPALSAALDRFAPPPMRAGFVDRVTEAARARAPRTRMTLVGVATFGLVSAAAAATGVFGPITRDTPVIGRIIASVAPSAIAKPKPKPTQLAKVKPRPVERAKSASVVPQVTIPSTEPALTDMQEARAQRIADRLEQRAERRKERGLPQRPIPRWKIKEALKDLPPEERRATIKRARELRREAKGLQPVTDEQRLAKIAKRQEKWRSLTTQERLEKVNARRARRGLPPRDTLPPALQ
jgi:hypothetical protein